MKAYWNRHDYDAFNLLFFVLFFISKLLVHIPKSRFQTFISCIVDNADTNKTGKIHVGDF